MSLSKSHEALRILMLITTPAYAEKASDLFRSNAVPIQYHWNAVGTAPNEMIDILGLGTPDKGILISVLPKPFADQMLQTLKEKLHLGTVNSGIAFSLPITGANHFVLRLLEPLYDSEKESFERKDEKIMLESKYSLIITVVNQGFCEEVMDTAREAGAGGGTLVHGRRIGDKETMNFLGTNVQEEKEMLFIVTETENKLNVMQRISEKYGILSEAKGIVLSMPIDHVIGPKISEE